MHFLDFHTEYTPQSTCLYITQATPLVTGHIVPQTLRLPSSLYLFAPFLTVFLKHIPNGAYWNYPQSLLLHSSLTSPLVLRGQGSLWRRAVSHSEEQGLSLPISNGGTTVPVIHSILTFCYFGDGVWLFAGWSESSSPLIAH